MASCSCGCGEYASGARSSCSCSSSSGLSGFSWPLLVLLAAFLSSDRSFSRSDGLLLLLAALLLGFRRENDGIA